MQAADRSKGGHQAIKPDINPSVHAWHLSDGSSSHGSQCNTTRDAQSHVLSNDELATALTVCAARPSRCMQPNQKPGMCVGLHGDVGALVLMLLRKADVCSNASQIQNDNQRFLSQIRFSHARHDGLYYIHSRTARIFSLLE
jgi:hypothetical protein